MRRVDTAATRGSREQCNERYASKPFPIPFHFAHNKGDATVCNNVFRGVLREILALTDASSIFQ
jgi:hypothetical protein